MNFLTFPLFIGGIAAAAVPIILHLIMRGVPKRIEFPPLRFLQKKQKVNQRKFRLRHLLLLALRIGVFVLIGFALARPSLRLDGFGGSAPLVGKLGTQRAPIAAAIVIDNSPRMDYQHANKTRLELAQAEARWVLSQLPEQSEVAVLSNIRMNDTFQVDLFSAMERINRLSTTPVGRSVGESVAAAIRLLQTSELESKEIYIFTDLTEAGWPQETANAVRSQLGEIGVYVVDLGVESPNNSGIAKLDLSAEVLSDGSSLQIDLDIVHFGNLDSRIVELYTLDSDKQEQRRSSEVVEFAGTAAPNEKAVRNLRFHLPNLFPGIHQGAVRFATSDGLEADDVRFFTVEVQSAWKALLVAPEPVEQKALFLREAIDPTAFRKQGGASFQTDTIGFGTFRLMRDSQWNDYRAIFLLDPPPLDAPLWKKLTDYASTGHGVGVFLGRKAKPIAAFQSDAAMELFGAKPVRQVPREDDPVFLNPNDLTSPILKEFRSLGDVNLIPWSLPPVFRYWEMSDLAASTQVEIRYSDGRPAILSKPIGQGMSVLVSTPISDSPVDSSVDSPNEEVWNLLPVAEPYWIFVGLAEGIGRLLVGAGDRTYNLAPGQTAVLHLSQDAPPHSILALPDGNTSNIPADANRRQLRFSATDQIGNYRLRSDAGGLSVNYNQEQLDLTRISASVLDEYFGEKKYRIAKDRNEIEIVVAKGRVGQELYPIILLTLCLLFAGEYVFSNRFYS